MHHELFERLTWAWCLSLIVLTIAIHSTGVVMLALLGARIRDSVENRPVPPHAAIALVTGLIGAVGLVLAALHGLEAMLWAVAYVWIGAIGSLLDALLYSLGAMTTAGAPGLGLPFRWQIMGAIESVNGMLLFGIRRWSISMRCLN